MKYLIGLLTLVVSNFCFAIDLAPEQAREWSSIEIVLTVSILIFTLVLIGIEFFIINKADKTWSPTSIMRLIGLTLIICLSTLLVVAGYGKEQLSAVLGLLGVIAGYLLGNNGQSQQPNK
ncbi:MAG: hypothetical protein CL579_01780 [Alteromonadaceae bacterium]|nr:hypothetical protein [Alteromonadaceae bacterium]